MRCHLIIFLTAEKVGRAHAERYAEGLKFDQSSKAKAKAKKKEQAHVNVSVHANWLAQITTYAKRVPREGKDRGMVW